MARALIAIVYIQRDSGMSINFSLTKYVSAFRPSEKFSPSLIFVMSSSYICIVGKWFFSNKYLIRKSLKHIILSNENVLNI